VVENRSLAPARNQTADSRPVERLKKFRPLSMILLAVLTALLLAGCGTSVLPTGILPSEEGNFVLRFSPAGAQVLMTRDGFATTSVGAHGASATEDEVGELRYRLTPGRYKLRIVSSGYRPYEETIEIDEDSSIEQPAVHPVELVAAPDYGQDGTDSVTDGTDGVTDGTDGVTDGTDGEGDTPVDVPDSVVSRGYALRGDPSFSISSLSTTEQLWYDRLWAGIERPDQLANSWASSGDLYQYGRYLNLYLSHLMLALRTTGDLALLDEIDRLTRKMEAKLKDAWRDGSTDGYLGWQWLNDSSESKYYGRDNHRMDEVMTHSVVAAVMYAFHVNRDLASPSGVDYGARADFWYGYLKNEFEAKWRDRNNKPSGFPFLDTNALAHPKVQYARYHYYMAQVSGDTSYRAEADRLAKLTDRNFVRTSSSSGPAFVWCHGTDDCMYAQPTNYIRYTISAVADLALEGMAPFDAPDYLSYIANSVTAFVIDNGARDLAPDISGNVVREGIPIRSGTVGDRDRVYYALPLALLGRYDGTGEIVNVVSKVYVNLESSVERPANIEFPAAMLFNLSVN
jgi:hypothetical protein